MENTLQFKEKVIDAVRRNPCIYDTSMKQHSVIRYREKAWQNIAEEFSISVNSAKSVFTTLRQQFSREMNKFEEEAGCDGEPLSNWYFFKQMRFLTPFMKRNATKRPHSTPGILTQHNVAFEVQEPKIPKIEPHDEESLTNLPMDSESNSSVLSPPRSSIEKLPESNDEQCPPGEQNAIPAESSSSNAEHYTLSLYCKIIEQKLRRLPPQRAEEIVVSILIDLNNEIFNK